MTSRRSLWVAAALAVAGLVLAGVLAREHAQAHAGIASFCAINDYVNCDRVATSRYSVVLGVPVAVWGALAYGAALALALTGLRRSRPHESWPAGLLFLLGAAATAVAVVLALVSELLVGALCLLCAASWLVSAGLLAGGWRATRPAGIAAAVRADLAYVRSRLWRSAALVVAAAALVLVARTAYPRYWERKAAAQARSAPVAVTAPSGPPVVVEFSDYQCPFCAIAHFESKKVLAARPDVVLVRKQFPLDPACNPIIKRPIHPDACTLAVAGICAEEQGKLDAMDDALFANQKEKIPLDAIVSRVGLDLPRFKECLEATSTTRRLQGDIASGIAVGIKATPTYVVNGVAYSGQLRADLLPPPVGPQSPAAPASSARAP